MNEPTRELMRLYANILEEMKTALEEDPNAGYFLQQLFHTAMAAVVERKERAIPAEHRAITGALRIH